MPQSEREDERSVVFERGTSDYDRTRALPPEAMEAVLGLLIAELANHQPCLEIGVGTGRMALPLFERGIRMSGVDLSPAMLSELRRKAGGRSPFPVARGDAVHLPFGDGTFGAGLAVHVLHLIPAWREVLTELSRVVRRPGLLLIDLGGWGTGWWKEIQRRFCEEAAIERPWRLGPKDEGEADEHISSLGGRGRALEHVQVVDTASLEEAIRRLEDGVYSFTWRTDEATRRAAGDRVRSWAAETIGPLDEHRETSRPIVWRAYDLS
jgi:ubiquinone/menaquinone biosynthesis C-methylase UbiE